MLRCELSAGCSVMESTREVQNVFSLMFLLHKCTILGYMRDTLQYIYLKWRIDFCIVDYLLSSRLAIQYVAVLYITSA